MTEYSYIHFDAQIFPDLAREFKCVFVFYF